MAKYVNLTASALVKTGAGRIKGIFVASASATPTIKIWDQTSAAVPVMVNTFTPVSATYYPIGDQGSNLSGGDFTNGLYITISGTVDCTVFFD